MVVRKVQTRRQDRRARLPVPLRREGVPAARHRPDPPRQEPPAVLPALLLPAEAPEQDLPDTAKNSPGDPVSIRHAVIPKSRRAGLEQQFIRVPIIPKPGKNVFRRPVRALRMEKPDIPVRFQKR